MSGKDSINWNHVVIGIILAFLAYGFIVSASSGNSGINTDQPVAPACNNWSGADNGC